MDVNKIPESSRERIIHLGQLVQEAEQCDKEEQAFNINVLNNIIAARKLLRDALAESLGIPLEECLLSSGQCAVSPAGVHVYDMRDRDSSGVCLFCK